MLKARTDYRLLVIRLEARLQPNIVFPLQRVLAVFTRSAITLPKVNRFGWNLKHCEYVVGGWPWQIVGAIRAVATAGEPGKFWIFCQVSNERFHRFIVCKISRNLNTTRRSVSEKTFETGFWKFYRSGSFLQKTQKFIKRFNVMRLQTAIIPQWL